MDAIEPQVVFPVKPVVALDVILEVSHFQPMVELTDEHVGPNLEALIRRSGKQKLALANHLNVSEQAVQKWIKKGTLAREHIRSICEFLNCSADELLGLVPINEAQSRQVARFETSEGYLRFQVMGEGGAGPGMINNERPEVLQEVDLAEWSVRNALGRMVSPARVKLLTVRGNSMAPRIKDGDVVFVDVQDTAIMDGGIFVFVMHGQAIVKRLDIRSDGFHIVSLAEPGNPDVIDPDQFDAVTIAGRVLGAIQIRSANEVAYG